MRRDLSKWIGLISDAPPPIKSALKTLLPTTFPIAISGWPRKAAVRVAPNSGSEVPIAIMVSPIKRSDRPATRAISIDP